MSTISKIIFSFFFVSYYIVNVKAQIKPLLNEEIALKLASKPMQCISKEYPNKTHHTINSDSEATLSPKQLHPSFYGCFDWHSSVHGHWMLVRLLKKNLLKDSNTIINLLSSSFQADKIKEEALYFSKYNLSSTFERTYGWAWVLQLDNELAMWDNPTAKVWHKNLKPLTEQILKIWKNYLPKQTYPNRTGVHPNTAFALVFALDWARTVGDKDFETQIIEKAKYFFLKDQNAPAYLEPDGSDFFSPSLEIADLMRRILPQKEFASWLDKFYEQRGIDNISSSPIISDIADYQIVHLVGLSFTKAWSMKGISKSLPEGHPLKVHFNTTSEKLIANAFPLLFESNYGGDHWLASFAVYALSMND